MTSAAAPRGVMGAEVVRHDNIAMAQHWNKGSSMNRRKTAAFVPPMFAITISVPSKEMAPIIVKTVPRLRGTG